MSITIVVLETNTKELKMEIAKNKLEYLSVNEIKSYAQNMRTHSGAQVDQICDSIKQFGFTNPILIDKDNIIIAGHGRLEAAKKMRIKTVPCIRLGDLNEDQVRALRIADNQLALNAGWDFEMLKLELDALQSASFDLQFTGFSETELTDIMGKDVKFGIDLNNQSDNQDDDDSDDDDDSPQEQKSLYSVETKTPIYEPLGLNVTLKDCLDLTKVNQLIAEIEKSKVSDEEKTFLKCAAYRHAVFHYKNTAEYYAANASPEMQQLMENSALVIIDFNSALKNGYVKLTKRIEQIMTEEGIE